MRSTPVKGAPGLYCDKRLGGIERWFSEPPEDAMARVPREIVKTVCFLCVKVQGKYDVIEDYFIGTAFFVSVNQEQTTFTYLVTARHVLDGARKNGHHDFFVRLNKYDGTSEVISLPDNWTYPDDPAVDLAIIPFSPRKYPFEYYSFPTYSSGAEAKKRLEVRDVGIGDDVLVAGLFSRRWGYRRNIPIVRSGIIAAMPDEPIIDDDGETFHAYLIEARSIAGLSGSPVFVVKDVEQPIDETNLSLDVLAKYVNGVIKRQPETYLLGLIRGHWNLEMPGEDSNLGESDKEEIDRFNVGIAAVTPSWDIHYLLHGVELTIKREEILKEIRKKHAPTLDSN